MALRDTSKICDHIYLVLLKNESLPANIIANIGRELLPHIFTLTLKKIQGGNFLRH